MTDEELIPLPSVDLVRASEVPSLLGQIRPSWQAKNLIVRVRRLVDVDPSSACQRLFNAAMHDLREKIVVAGLDIAKEAAKRHKLPPVESPEDVENYPVAKLIDLAYRIGLLSRAEWRRISRSYEIRRDLEHEDDQYEAGVEDCIYIFKSCIEAVLARDPVTLLRVEDVKDVVQQPAQAFPSAALLADFEHAPEPRQEEIAKFLMSVALDDKQSELVRQNAYTFLAQLEPLIQPPVKLSLTAHLQERLGRRPLDRLHVRIAYAAGILPYLKQAEVRDFFNQVLQQMRKVGSDWRKYTEHGELLRSLGEIGGLDHCPAALLPDVLTWLVLTYVGEPGGMTRFGHVRPVFFSDTAAPLIESMVTTSKTRIREPLKALRTTRPIGGLLNNQHLARRFEALLDLVE